jgi:hypothetical protein
VFEKLTTKDKREHAKKTASCRTTDYSFLYRVSRLGGTIPDLKGSFREAKKGVQMI